MQSLLNEKLGEEGALEVLREAKHRQQMLNIASIRWQQSPNLVEGAKKLFFETHQIQPDYNTINDMRILVQRSSQN